MAIDKRIPRVLNSDADNKTVNKVSMSDALNLYSGPDNEGFDATGKKLDAGKDVLKNIRGNVAVDAYPEEALPSDARVLGSVEDVRTDITYLFVYSVNADNHGVWAYDKKDILSNAFGGESTGNPVLRLIYKSSQFNFPQNGFVKGDIVYSNASRSFEDEDLDKDVILYFTDGVNEPRKINAYRAFVESEGQQINGSDIYAEADFITACPKTPLVPIEFVFQNEPDRSTSNFERTRGFQFAYQAIYKDGAESAISSYSNVAFPPSILDQGAQTYVNHSDFNKCVLTIPAQGPEIEKVRLLCREGNDGSFLIIDELDAGVTSYNFFNDRILKGVSTNEVNKQFDSIPRSAVAQTVSSNRLMYGNYLDGFNKSTTTATATVIYKNRPEDFIAYTINVVPSIFSPKFGQGVSFFMDFQEMPDFLPADTIVNVSVTLTPDTNFHFFYTKGGGVSQTRQVGPQVISSNDEGLFSGVNANQGNALSQTESGVSAFDDGEIFGSATTNIYSGINDYNYLSANYWNYTGPYSIEGVPMIDQQIAVCGSSAAHPIIIKGKSITFSTSLEITQDLSNAQAKLNLAVREAFINKNISSSTFQTNPQPFEIPDFGITILQNNCTPSYSFDLELNSGDLISQPYIGKEDANNDSENKLINAVYGYSMGAATSGESGVPVGYFIFNKGKATWMLSENSQALTDAYSEDSDDFFSGDSYFNYDSSTSSHFMLHLVDFSDVEPLTCLHDTAPDPQTPAALSWIVISEQDVIEFGTNIDFWLDQVGINSDEIHGFANNPYGDNSAANVTKGYGHQIGYLYSGFNQQQYTLGTLFPLALDDPQYVFHSYAAPANGYNATGGFTFQGLPPQGLDLGADLIVNPVGIIADGEGGPGGGPARSFDSENDYDKMKMYAQGSVTVNPYERMELAANFPNYPDYLQEFVAEYQYSDTVFYGGELRPTNELQIVTPASGLASEGGSSASISSSFVYGTTLPFLRKIFNQDTSYILQLPEAADDGISLEFDSVDFSKQQSVVELNKTVNFASGSFDFGGVESFKTEASHDFGIVYYDERGRHGFVDYLTTAFVEGYTNEERGLGNDGKGAVEVSLQLTGTPPDWAHSYKIVYGENSTVQDFVQYSAGGAFVGGNPDNVEISDFNKNIYVSLNYLQGHPVSYVNAFGARTQEGGLNLYKFEEGDKLRVISYFDGAGINYKDYEFDVVDLVVLGDGQNETNPLSNNPEQNQQGEFLVIKDNPEAFGFSHADVLSDLHNWGKNCIVEIRTPKKSIDVEDQIYYEISDHYKVVKNNSGNLVHDVNPVVVKNGDVWFRPVATNIREFENGEYVDIIADDDGADPAPQPNFKNVFLETQSATDLFKSDSFSRGRPNVIFEDAAETKREATITYSDPSNPESFRIRYSSFNSSLANFKDLSDRYGDIEYIANHNDYIVVIQKEKVSIVPVNKNVLSDASGNQQIIASLNVLGEVIAYPGVSGCDDDPSSVYDSGEQVYFCNKSLSKVYRFTRQSGVEEISEKGMSSLIRASLQKAIEVGDNVRVVGGYDTLKEEYLLSIVNIPVRTTGFVEEVVQETQEDDVTPVEDEPNIVINPSDVLDFGELELTDTINPKQVIVSNTGLANLIINGFDINDGVAINFELVSANANVSDQNPMVIEPNASETILISIIPPGEDGAIDSFLEIYSNDPDTPILDLPLTVLFRTLGDEGNGDDGSEDDSDGEALSPFTQAYNDFYGTDLTDQDMSKELAFQYLQDLEGTPGEPTLLDLRNFMDSAVNNQTNVQTARLDIDADAAVDVHDLLDFTFLYGIPYTEGIGMFSGLIPATGSAPAPKATPPPPSKPKPTTVNYFKSVDGAINYLFVQNELTVGEYHLLRAQINDNFSLNLNEQGPVNTFDLIQMLQVFLATTDPDEPAFASTPTPDQGGIPAGPSSLETILWLIDDGTMTVGQYFYLASYVKLAAKADANEDNQVSTADLLNMLGVWGFGTQEQGTSYSLNDPAFNL